MSQLIFKNLPEIFTDYEINFKEIKNNDEEVITEFVEYLQDVIYTSKAEFDKNPECVKKKDLLKMISKYK